jgi:hypothetical protein
MKRGYLILLCLGLMLGAGRSVSRPEQQRSTTKELLRTSSRLASIARQSRNQAQVWAERNQWPVRQVTDENQVVELQRMTDRGPQYYTTMNSDAARSVSTRSVLNDPEFSSLDGTGMILGLWDAGAVRLDHQEFQNRVWQMDAASQLSSHATQVCGSLGSVGIVESARGMAPGAEVNAWDWNSDVAEMMEAAASGLLLSNHSYGLIAGWVWNLRGDNRWVWFGDPLLDAYEDAHFGYYSSQAAQWDALAEEAPYYLIVKAAGNERDDRGPNPGEQHWVWNRQSYSWQLSSDIRKPDGEYDCLAGTAVCKNVLVVGSIYDITEPYTGPNDVRIASNSSWGPTDDGRIKPDLVANGVGLYTPSAQHPSAYTRYSGTSAATPVVTGSLGLVQRAAMERRGDPLLASTLRALVIHTAREAGEAPGPDYRFGWGVMDTRACIEEIRHPLASSRIREEILMPDDTFQWSGHVTAGVPVKVTLAWTDPAGVSPSFRVDNPTPMLIHDLDVGLEPSDGNETILPWTLDPSDPAAPAGRGKNRLDNVEVIDWVPDVDGKVTLNVDAPSGISSRQTFSLVISGIEPMPSISLVAGLEGAREKNASRLATRLREQGLIPLDSPYSDAPARIDAVPDSVVDWVLVSLGPLNSHSVIHRQSALLRDDGYLIDPETGTSKLEWSLSPGSYWIRIEHRNHLPLLSSITLNETEQATLFDFNTVADSEQTIRETSSPETRLLISGDVNGDCRIDARDYIRIQKSYGQSGYRTEDLNLDGRVDRGDLDLYFKHQGFSLLANPESH